MTAAEVFKNQDIYRIRLISMSFLMLIDIRDNSYHNLYSDTKTIKELSKIIKKSKYIEED